MTGAGSRRTSFAPWRRFRCDIAQRVDQLPPYLFAELERKIAEKRAAGVDVISLGIGDPDMPDLPGGGRGGAAPGRPAGHPPVPVEPGPRGVPRGGGELLRAPVRRRARPRDARCCRCSAARRAMAHVCWSMLDPGDVCLAADPGYPVYTSGPLLAGAEPVLMPLTAGERVPARPGRRSPADVRARANLLFCNYPNNPTGRGDRGRLLRAAGPFRARQRHPDRPRQRLLGDHLRRARGRQLPRRRRARARRASRCSRCPSRGT